MNFKKYIWKCRLLVLNTPNYNNQEYKSSKDIYQKHIKEFHISKLCYILDGLESKIILFLPIKSGK